MNYFLFSSPARKGGVVDIESTIILLIILLRKSRELNAHSFNSEKTHFFLYYHAMI